MGGIADRARMFELLSATWIAQGCYALVKLGIPDLLSSGPKSLPELAEQSGSNQPALGRVLRALSAAGVVALVDAETYQLTSLGQLLRTDVARSSRDAAVMFGEEVFRSFAEIGYTVRTGKPAFEQVYGKPFYDYLADSPDAARTFASAMGNGPVPAALATCDLTGLRRIVDVGGGNGGLLAKVLHDRPQATGVLVDLAPAIGQARERLAAAGVADRVELVASSFFDVPIPPGGDVYVLSRVLHNWADAEAVRLLHGIRAAIPADGRLLIFEELMPTAPEEADGASAAHLVDLLMLVMLPGSDRTVAEYSGLLGQAGFAVTGVRHGPWKRRNAESVIEAVPTRRT
jgi:O-methyltransferase domain